MNGKVVRAETADGGQGYIGLRGVEAGSKVCRANLQYLLLRGSYKFDPID